LEVITGPIQNALLTPNPQAGMEDFYLLAGNRPLRNSDWDGAITTEGARNERSLPTLEGKRARKRRSERKIVTGRKIDEGGSSYPRKGGEQESPRGVHDRP